MKPEQKLPDCATWNVWYGHEIEGTEDLGEETLFVRKLPIAIEKLTDAFINQLTKKGHIERIWFCANFREWEKMRKLLPHFKKVCLEVNLRYYYMVPPDVRNKARLYFKVPVPLKPGDFVCVGLPFRDESFKIGSGVRVTPQQYSKDIKIV